MKRLQPYKSVSANLNEITLLKLECLIIPNLLIDKGMNLALKYQMKQGKG